MLMTRIIYKMISFNICSANSCRLTEWWLCYNMFIIIWNLCITNLLSFVFENILSDTKEDFQMICTYIGFWIIPDEAAIQVILLFF